MRALIHFHATAAAAAGYQPQPFLVSPLFPPLSALLFSLLFHRACFVPTRIFASSFLTVLRLVVTVGYTDGWLVVAPRQRQVQGS